MIENQTVNYKEPRLSYDQYAEVKKQYRKEAKKEDQGCIVKLASDKEWRRLV